MSQSTCFTISSLARHWRVGKGVVDELIESGALRTTDIAGRLRITPAAVEAYENRGDAEPVESRFGVVKEYV